MPLLPVRCCRFLPVLLVTGTLALFSACSTLTVPAAPVGAFRQGELEVTAAADFAVAYAASKKALATQGLFLTRDNRRADRAVLTARDRSDAQVTVQLEAGAAGQTTIRIRYGLAGDADRSQALYRAIAGGW